MKKVRITERGTEYLPLDTGDQPFSDELDIAKITVDVDKAIKAELGKDYVLAYFQTNQREFIQEQVKLAFILNVITPDSTIGERIRKAILLETHSIAVLHRNLDKNPLINLLLKKHTEEEQEPPDADDIYQRIKKRLKPDEAPA